MNYTKVILAALVIFACGVVSGFLLSSAHRHPMPPPPSAGVTNALPPWQSQRLDFLRRITKHLELTTEQRERIDKILQESQKRTRPLWEQIAPQLQQELTKVRDDIRAELNPQQQEKFEKLLKIRPPRRSDVEDKNHRRPGPFKKQQMEQSETVTNN